jgi:multidrug efflux pump subunit AcrA (membrane-fusion protein)
VKTTIIVLLGVLVASAEWSAHIPSQQAPTFQVEQRAAPTCVVTAPTPSVPPVRPPEPQAVPSSSPSTDAHRLLGLVVPAAQVIVRAQEDGVVAERLVEVGQRIAMGDPVLRLDDADLVLDAERQKARLGAIKHRIASAKAELLMLEKKGAQLEKAASSPFEATQARCLITAAKARVGELEEEYREGEIACRGLERRRLKYRCLSPISGEVVETQRVRHEYVRQGEVIAKVQSIRRHVTVHVPQALVPQIGALQFSMGANGKTVDLDVVEIKPNADLSGARLATLNVPVSVELAAGQTVEVEVSVQP